MDLGAGEIGCLLLHGLTASAAEMSSLERRLNASGYQVRAPNLPGHGSRVEDLADRKWQDWYGEAERSWNELGGCRFRTVAGTSLGALIALHLACERSDEVDAVAVLAPALELYHQRRVDHALWLSRLPWLPRSLAYVSKGTGAPVPAGREAYETFPIGALASLVELQRLVRPRIPEMRAPLLVVEGGLDRTIAPGVGEWLERTAGSTVRARRVFPASTHLLTEDVDREAVADLVAGFFAEVAENAGGASTAIKRG